MSGSKINAQSKNNHEHDLNLGHLLSNLRLAAEYADLARQMADIYDDAGMKFCADRFIDHAKLASDYLKKIRKEIKPDVVRK